MRAVITFMIVLIMVSYCLGSSQGTGSKKSEPKCEKMETGKGCHHQCYSIKWVNKNLLENLNLKISAVNQFIVDYVYKTDTANHFPALPKNECEKDCRNKCKSKKAEDGKKWKCREVNATYVFEEWSDLAFNVHIYHCDEDKSCNAEIPDTKHDAIIPGKGIFSSLSDSTGKKSVQNFCAGCAVRASLATALITSFLVLKYVNIWYRY